jgi:hypothetical protein
MVDIGLVDRREYLLEQLIGRDAIAERVVGEDDPVA